MRAGGQRGGQAWWRTAWPAAVVVAMLCGAGRLRAQPSGGSVTGVVTTTTPAGVRPVRNAEVHIEALRLATRTDTAGRYLLTDVPIGAHRLEIRALGFAPVVETVRVAGGRVQQDATLTATVTQLATVGTTADAPVEGRLADFDARRRLGIGKFTTREVWEKADGRRFADVMTARVPGLMSIAVGGERYLATGSRGTISLLRTPGEQGKPKECYVQVVVDGLVRYRSTPGETLFNIDSIDPRQVEGTEFFTVSQTPQQYNNTGGASCGTLVIWLKM